MPEHSIPSTPAEVRCNRCDQTRQGLVRPPLPGELGRSIHLGTCSVCWAEWMAQQTILMNEKALTPVNPEHYALIVSELRTFLKLPQPQAADTGEDRG